MKRRITGGGLLLALAFALAAAYRSDRILFENPAENTPHYFDKIGYALEKHRGIHFLMTFDEARPREWVGRGPVRYPGTECVPGRFGKGRRFNGSQHTYMETAVSWDGLGSAFTLSLWVDLENTGRDQDIWYTAVQQRQTGFALRNGQLTFFVPGEQGEQAAAYPFEAFGRFVHLVGVADGPGGTARLYENGELKAEIPVANVAPPSHNMEFGKMRWYSVTDPLRGVLDEAVAWKRALPPEEVRSLAQAHHSLPSIQAPGCCLRWRFAQAVEAAIPAILKAADLFNPFLHEDRAATADLPGLQLYFSSKDARHFIRRHERSLASGRRVGRGANPRRIQAQYGGRTVDAQLWLDGSDTRYPPGKRPGFILEAPADVPAFGSRQVRLTPPENMGSDLSWIESSPPTRANGGPVAKEGLCRLAINGQPKGIYHYESFDQCGLAPGERDWVARGPKHPGDWTWLFRDPPQSGNSRAREFVSPATANARLEDVRRLLVNDMHHPWSAREWAWRIRTHRAEHSAPPTPTLSPAAVLGSNPSPYYVVEDLDLHAIRGGPTNVVWSSSRPDLIDENGKVTRPAGDSPAGVDLTATFGAGDNAEKVRLSFRVMPADRKLPALMLYFEDPLTSTQRTDFQALYRPAHDEGAPRRLAGGQATGGGIKHHGNTSYWKGQKKPLSLRFDEPHHLVGHTETRYMYLLNGYVDSTKLRNKLVFDLFREFGGAENPRVAPEFDWTEVFVNGTYFGVYEMCTRIDGVMAGFKENAADPESSGVVYKIRPSPTLFAEERLETFEQTFPSPTKFPHAKPLLDLVAFTGGSAPEKFAREIGDWVDLDNAVDFLLLLNFTGNTDGRTTNFSLARDGAPGSKFFFIPWDYDHTFDPQDIWLSNHLFDRLGREYPGFEDRERRRWGELRQGLLSNAHLDARITEMAGHLAGYMDWEIALLGYPVPPTYMDTVEELRRNVRVRLKNMDARLGFATPAGAGGM